MKNLFDHLRTFIFRGLIALIPILLCYFAVRLLHGLIDKRVGEFLSDTLQIKNIPGIGILLVLIVLYFTGVIVSNIIGKQFFVLIESVTQRIPFINTVYNVGKQLSDSFGGAEKKTFQKAVLVKLTGSDLWMPAFLMATLKDKQTGENLTSVFVPTAPNPASGFVVIAKAHQIFDPGWSTEEGIKAIFSLGIIIPKDIQTQIQYTGLKTPSQD